VVEDDCEAVGTSVDLGAASEVEVGCCWGVEGWPSSSESSSSQPMVSVGAFAAPGET